MPNFVDSFALLWDFEFIPNIFFSLKLNFQGPMEKPVIENWLKVQRSIQNKPKNEKMIDTLKQLCYY